MHHKRTHEMLLIFIITSICTVSTAAETNVDVQANVDTLIENNQCVDCNLVGANLNRMNLAKADLSGADLTGATFFLADLSGANLKNTILRGVQFGGADLSNADLTGADLRGAETKGAYLAGAVIDGSFENKAISDDDDLKDVNEKVYIPDPSKPKEVVENKKVEIEKRIDLDSVQPSSVIAPVVENAELKGPSEMQDSQPAPPVKVVKPVGSITIEEKSIIGNNVPIAEDKPAAVSDNESIKSEVKSVEQTVVNEQQADSAKKIESEGISEIPIEKKVEEDQKVIADISESPNVLLWEKLEDTNKCFNCNFSGMNLAGEDLEGADLERADFTDANLQGIDFEDANLKGVSFRNANLKDARFEGADLYKADFTGADLNGANFEDAKIDEAVFTRAKGYNINLVIETP